MAGFAFVHSTGEGSVGSSCCLPARASSYWRSVRCAPSACPLGACSASGHSLIRA